jgi:DNA-binding NtrC family response regulator
MIERIRGRSWPGNIRQLEYVTRELVRRRGIGGLLWDSFVVEDVFRKIDENPNQLPQERAEPVIPAVAVNKPPPAWPSPPVVADAVKALALAKDIDSVIDNLENALIEETLSEVGKDRAQAAARLGLTPGALTKRMARLKKRLASRSPSISPAKP